MFLSGQSSLGSFPSVWYSEDNMRTWALKQIIIPFLVNLFMRVAGKGEDKNGQFSVMLQLVL